jgi:hypothetical protein
MNPFPICPFCRSPNVVTRATGLKVLGSIGILVGAAGALHAALKQLPKGSFALPSLALTAIAAGVLSALRAGAVGCRIGTKAGSQLDEMLLGNRYCLHCKRSFCLP